MVGDQIAAMAYKNNWSGIFVDGYIRDIEIIQDIEIGVYAKNAYPKKTDKSIGIGIKDSRFKIGTVDVSSGSWIYVDTNGWLVSNEELEF
jgi:regulator of ribonuclease activity A